MEINVPIDKAISGAASLFIGGFLIVAYGRSAVPFAKSTLYVAKLLAHGLAYFCFKEIPSRLWNRRKRLLTVYGISLLPHSLAIAIYGVKQYIEFKGVMPAIFVSSASIILTTISAVTADSGELEKLEVKPKNQIGSKPLQPTRGQSTIYPQENYAKR